MSVRGFDLAGMSSEAGARAESRIQLIMRSAGRYVLGQNACSLRRRDLLRCKFGFACSIPPLRSDKDIFYRRELHVDAGEIVVSINCRFLLTVPSHGTSSTFSQLVVSYIRLLLPAYTSPKSKHVRLTSVSMAQRVPLLSREQSTKLLPQYHTPGSQFTTTRCYPPRTGLPHRT